MNEWITVKDKLHSDSMAVSCYKLWEERDDQNRLWKITHWMSFPKPPKNDE